MAATLKFQSLLDSLKSGDRHASAQLVALVYDDLKRLARAHGAREGRTLNATALVNECYQRLAHGAHAVESKNHFFNLASRIMRQVLCDYARERVADKRGGGVVHETLSAAEQVAHREAADLVELDDVLKRFEQTAPSAARVFECRYFAGLSEQETADALNLSLRTTQREWQHARQWLAEQLGPA
jgi:RNA polymerase sigma factor (TIGR02999 family)